MKNIFWIATLLLGMGVSSVQAQEPLEVKVFERESINFNGTAGPDKSVMRYQSGRIIVKKVDVPVFEEGTDVQVKLTVRSAGDRWDKSGSCFVISDPDKISILDVSSGDKSFPLASGMSDGHGGVRATADYTPALEILRFMTPFGVGHFSTGEDTHRKPVYIPKWEKEVVWESNITHLLDAVNESFYVGIWIDTWTAEGYEVDLSFSYSNRPYVTCEVVPLVNTIPYVSGQSLPDFFPTQDIKQEFELKKKVRNARLHYITTGHGGHSGGDEFIKIKNTVSINGNKVLDFSPWRDDCASFRRFNPTSGVWLRKDSAAYIDFQERKYKVKEIEERIASSDLSRSNWCPGSKVEPIVLDLGDLEAGKHELLISIGATPADKDKFNHWLVSAYITYEE